MQQRLFSRLPPSSVARAIINGGWFVLKHARAARVTTREKARGRREGGVEGTSASEPQCRKKKEERVGVLSRAKPWRKSEGRRTYRRRRWSESHCLHGLDTSLSVCQSAWLVNSFPPALEEGSGRTSVFHPDLKWIKKKKKNSFFLGARWNSGQCHILENSLQPFFFSLSLPVSLSGQEEEKQSEWRQTSVFLIKLLMNSEQGLSLSHPHWTH